VSSWFAINTPYWMVVHLHHLVFGALTVLSSAKFLLDLGRGIPMLLDSLWSFLQGFKPAACHMRFFIIFYRFRFSIHLGLYLLDPQNWNLLGYLSAVLVVSLQDLG
jgi:hypothetical protein